MKKKLKRTIAALSAIAMLGTTATVLPEGMSFDFGTGITASATSLTHLLQLTATQIRRRLPSILSKTAFA